MYACMYVCMYVCMHACTLNPNKHNRATLSNSYHFFLSLMTTRFDIELNH